MGHEIVIASSNHKKEKKSASLSYWLVMKILVVDWNFLRLSRGYDCPWLLAFVRIFTHSAFIVKKSQHFYML